jgi:3-methylcrotonyl-CoA carboxylase beta subunit
LRKQALCRGYHASVLPSLVSSSSPEFLEKSEAMNSLVSDIETKMATAREGGGAKAAERMRSKGKKLPRERSGWFIISTASLSLTCCDSRLNLLLDPHSPFLELSPLAAHDVYSEPIPGAGLITGIGRVSGRECMVLVNDATVKGGSYYPLTVSFNALARHGILY